MLTLHSKAPRCLILGAILTSAACGAIAEPAAPLDRFSLSAGAFSTEPDIMVDADTTFGRIESGRHKSDRTTLPRLKAEMLLGDRQSIAIDFIRYNKPYNPTLSGTTVIDGETISGTASFNGHLRLDLSKAAYKWWFGQQNDVFGIGVGVGHYRAKVGGTASAEVQGPINGVPTTRTVSGSDSTSDSANAPLLDLGWRHAFSPDLRMFVEGSGVKKNGGRINGHIYSAAVGAEWFMTKNIGLALDYGIQKIDLHRDSDRDSNLLIKLVGPSAYLRARF
jgi:hypothetical protein